MCDKIHHNELSTTRLQSVSCQLRMVLQTVVTTVGIRNVLCAPIADRPYCGLIAVRPIELPVYEFCEVSYTGPQGVRNANDKHITQGKGARSCSLYSA